jgi:hypothetical protein
MHPKQINRIIRLQPEEEIVAIVHQSIVPFLGRLLLALLWLLVPFFFMFPLWGAGPVGRAIFFCLAASGFLALVKILVKWSNTVLVLTDRRVVDIDQRALFDRVVSEAPFYAIDDVSYRVPGIVPTIFGYGHLRLLISGNAADIVFHRAKQPRRVHDLINELRET